MKREPTRGERLLKTVTFDLRQANDADRTIEHVITARTVDRDGDVVEPMGVRTDNFKKNPVVLLGHSSWGFPVARNLALDKSPDQIMALTQFAGLDQAAPEAETAYRLARDGFMKAWSIGFMPITWSEDKALPTQDGWWFKETELYEYSLVAIPSNPQALTNMAKAFGLPAGATEKDFLDAVRKDRKRYFDVGAALLIGAKTVPGNPGNAKAPKDAAWSAPSLADFTSKAWGDLSDSEKNAIARHFAWADELPPKSFGDLKLPHHNPDGAVVFRGVVAAAGRLDQTQGVDAAAVRAHLEAHYHEFGEQAPWESKGARPGRRKDVGADVKELILAATSSIFNATIAATRSGDEETADALVEIAGELMDLVSGQTTDGSTVANPDDGGGWPTEPTADPGGPLAVSASGHHGKRGAVVAQRNMARLQAAQGKLAEAGQHHAYATKCVQDAGEQIKAVMDDGGTPTDDPGSADDGTSLAAAVAAAFKELRVGR
jgi:HK97 family phage prohead protease